jgi:DNA-binding NarL/FixJ family response regulator
MKANLSTTSIQVLLLDDHLIFMQGFSTLLRKMYPDLIVNTATSIHIAKKLLEESNYHFLISDISIPGENTLEFVRYCQKEYSDLKIIMLSSSNDIGSIKSYFQAGISGYLGKAVDSEELILAIEKIMKGDKYVSSNISARLVTSFLTPEQPTLTKKELEIINMVSAGHSVAETSKILNISHFTVLGHRRNIMKKLNLHSAAELVKYAYENKLNTV